MRVGTIFAALAAASAILPLTSVSAVTPITVHDGKPFKHKLSGIVVAPEVAGIPRASVAEFDDKQLDVEADFRTADGAEITSIYIFRNVTGDVPLWFDRIQRTVEASKMLSSPTLAIAPASFVPAGQSNARGIRAVYAAQGQWKSSAAALTATDGWFVAIRASSKTLTPPQLLDRLQQSFAAIKWPREKSAIAAAYLVDTCPTALAQGADASPVQDPDSVVLSSALSATVGNAVTREGIAKAARWCRDPYTMDGAGVYRPNGATDRYFIAFQDAGRGLIVQPNGLAGILAGATGSGPLSYMVEVVDIDHRSGVGSFNALPTFAQAMWLNEHGNRLYSATTWGRDNTITVSDDAIK